MRRGDDLTTFKRHENPESSSTGASKGLFRPVAGRLYLYHDMFYMTSPEDAVLDEPCATLLYVTDNKVRVFDRVCGFYMELLLQI